MSRISVTFSELISAGENLNLIKSKLNQISSEFQSTIKDLDWDIKCENNINNTANQLSNKLDNFKNALGSYQQFLSEAHKQYTELDNQNVSISIEKNGGKSSIFGAISSFFNNKMIGTLLAGSGYIGTMYGLIRNILNGDSWADLAKNGLNVYDFLNNASKELNNYKKIGNAVGSKKSFVWWLKNAIGLKPLGRASSATNIGTRFRNNLFNKTSPFYQDFQNTIKSLKGQNGAAKAAASWAPAIISGVTNGFSNYDEYKSGKISGQRAIAEWATETAVDVGLTYVAGTIAGAAVTTALGTVAAPGIAVVAITGGLGYLANLGIEKLTGKTATEWVSDNILDGIEAGAKKVGNAFSNFGKAVASWFS